MKEAQKCLKEKGIRAEDVKNLPPMEELCKQIPHSSTIEVHSLQHFDEGDIPYGKPPDQSLEELDIFIIKQGNFTKQVQNHLLENSRAIKELKDIVERTSNDIKMLCKHFQMVQTQLDQLAKVQKDMLVNASGDKHAYGIRTRSGIATQDRLYPKGHPKRIEQDSQQGEYSGSTRKRKKNKHKIVEEPLEPAVDPNSIYVSDAELRVVMIKMSLLIRRKVRKNLRSTLRTLGTQRKILLLINMVKRENLGCRNLCLFQVRNTSQRRKNTTTSFVSG